MRLDDAKVLMEAITSAKFKRTPFEEEFLSNMKIRLERGNPVTSKQGKILEQIYRKSQGG